MSNDDNVADKVVMNQPMKAMLPVASSAASRSSTKNMYVARSEHSSIDQNMTSHALTPVRLIKTLPVSSDGNNNQPIVRIIKNTAEGQNISPANIINVRAPLSSPIKGGTVINIPSGTRIISHPKLKVGDTITIQKSLSVNENSHKATSSSTQSLIQTTPTKVMTSHTMSPSTSSAASTSSHIEPTPQNNVPSPVRFATISSSSWSSPSPMRGKRPSVFVDQMQASESKRARRGTPTHGEKGGKGLRHFAMLVCEKVKQKGTTTYNEVADELVAEYSDQQRQQLADQQYDQKNIRRRVYDALNVLMAMEIIYKDKKDIHWVGLPTNSAQEVQTLQIEKSRREQRIQQKTLQLQELILQQIAFKNLVQRNKRLQETRGSPPENSAIQLPFIIVNTCKKTVIDCSISNDKYEYLFNFDNTFEIHDDIEVLKRMGMAYGLDAGACSPDDLKTALTLVPPVLKPYLERMAGVEQKADDSQRQPILRTSQATSSPVISFPSQLENMSGAAPKRELSEGADFPYSELQRLTSSAMKPDPDDQEVAMVTDSGGHVSNSSGVAMSFSSGGSASSASSRPHSSLLSLTPLSSSAGIESGSESRDSTPTDSGFS